MERKRIDDYEPGLVPPHKPVDRFGFVKQDITNSTEGLNKSRLTNDHERYSFLSSKSS